MFKPELSLSPSGMPFLTNQNIDSIGEQMAVDFDKAILLNPHELDIDRFVERYLKMAVDFMYLSHCGVYLGTTVFQTTDWLPVYLPEENCADYAHVDAGTIIIDSSLAEESQEHRYRYTLGHEGGHSVLHTTYFLNTIGSSERDQTGIYVRCRADFKIGRNQFSGIRNMTDIERAEQQANRFSAAILMPKSAVKILLARKPYNRKAGWIADAITKISETFNVSYAAAFYRLKDLEIIEQDAICPFRLS